MVKANFKRSSQQTFLLVKNRLLAQTGINLLYYERDERKKRNKIFFLVSIAFVFLMLEGYLIVLAIAYGKLGLNDLTPSLSLIIASLVTLFFTMFKANGELFAFKDYETLMSLPVATATVINSRFLNMYIWNTLFSFAVMLPMGFVYAYFAKAHFLFYPLWLIGMLLASLIPTTLAAIFGAGITAIAQKFKYANLMTTIFSFIFVILIFLFSFGVGTLDPTMDGLFLSNGNFNEATVASLATIVQVKLFEIYPPAKLFVGGIVEGQLGAFSLFTFISLASYGLFISLLAKYYKGINSAITARGTRGRYQLKKLQQSKPVLALTKKTVLRILKSTVAATNLLMGCVMALVASLIIFIIGPEMMLQGMELKPILPVLKSSAPFIISAIIGMTNTAAISLALEGKSIWLIQSLPLAPKTIYQSYLLVNLIFTVPTALISSVLVSFALGTNVKETLALILTPLVIAFATALAGVVIGNRLAYYDWEDETHLIKQSMMTIIAMLGSLISIAIFGGITNSGFLPGTPFSLTMGLNVIILIASWLVFQRESKRPVKR